KWAIVAMNDSMICMTEYAGRVLADHHDDESFHQIDHFGIRVSDVDQWLQIVNEHKLRVYYGGVVEYPYSRSWYVQDPSGHAIEVSYTDQERLQFPSRGAK